MENSDDVFWHRVARVVSWSMTTVVGALFLLELAVVFGVESVSAWESFAMLFGTLLWFGFVTMTVWEGTTNGHLHKRQSVFLAFEIFCTALFLASFLGHFYETLKMLAMILNVIVSLAFLVVLAHISVEIQTSHKKYKRVK